MAKLFENITSKNKEKILRLLEAHRFTFKKGVNILSIIMGNNICLVDSGSIDIKEEDYDGKVTIIDTINEGDVFGSKMSLMTNGYYEILTKSETDIIVIDYDQIISLENVKYDYYMDFLKNLLSIMNEKNKEKNERIEILTKRSIRDKLLEYFRIESKKVGTNVFYLSMTLTDLALYLAVDRSAMSRELKSLKEEGFIEIEGKKVKLDVYEK